MGMNADPDEMDVISLTLIQRRVEERLAADGLLCEQDRAVIAAFEDTRMSIGARTRQRRAFAAYLRNGDGKYTRRLLRDAGLTLTEIDTDADPRRTPCDGHPPVALPIDLHAKRRRSEATPNDAA